MVSGNDSIPTEGNEANEGRQTRKISVDALDLVHGIREAQRRGQAKALLWPWSRMTAFRRVQEVIAAAGIPDGPHACPKGLRHGFGVQAVSRGIALNMVQKWLGHAQLTTTAIYANAVGEDNLRITLQRIAEIGRKSGRLPA